MINDLILAGIIKRDNVFVGTMVSKNAELDNSVFILPINSLTDKYSNLDLYENVTISISKSACTELDKNAITHDLQNLKKVHIKQNPKYYYLNSVKITDFKHKT